MNIQIGHDAALVESKKQLISGTYLRNAWYCAAWSEALGDSGVLGVTILKEPVVLYRRPMARSSRWRTVARIASRR